MQEPTTKMMHNAHKLVFLAFAYPEHDLEKLMKMLQLPAIDINSCFWIAARNGWLGEPDAKTKSVERIKEPESYDFGPDYQELREKLIYAFHETGSREQDIEEQYLGAWLMGYPQQDILIVMKQLLSEKVLGEYDLTDPKDLKSTYHYFSLYENSEQMWGRKEFEQQPTGAEKPDNSDVEDGGTEAPTE